MQHMSSQNTMHACGVLHCLQSPLYQMIGLLQSMSGDLTGLYKQRYSYVYVTLPVCTLQEMQGEVLHIQQRYDCCCNDAKPTCYLDDIISTHDNSVLLTAHDLHPDLLSALPVWLQHWFLFKVLAAPC